MSSEKEDFLSGHGFCVIVAWKRVLFGNRDDMSEELNDKNDEPENLLLISRIKELSVDPDQRAEARDLCFQALNASPQNLVVRLLLARLFYLDRLGEFCIRELIELRKRCDTPSIKKLLDGFGDYGRGLIDENPQGAGSTTVSRAPAGNSAEKEFSPRKEEVVLAEVDLDTDFAEVLDELEDE